jgi:hypothetical protein
MPGSSEIQLLAVFMLCDTGIFESLGVSEGEAEADGLLDIYEYNECERQSDCQFLIVVLPG